MSSSSNDENYTPEGERKKQKRKYNKGKEKKDKIKSDQIKRKKKETKVYDPSNSIIRKKKLEELPFGHSFDKGKTVQGVNLEDILPHSSPTSHRIKMNCSTDSSDYSFDLEEDHRVSKNKSELCRKGKGKANSTDRTRAMREKRYHDRIMPLDDGYPFDEPVIVPSNNLGSMTNECFHCGALHFPGKLNCCMNGKVFIPPFQKLPEPLESLLHGPRGRGYAETNKFLNTILIYNSNFSLASMQFSRSPVSHHGVQAVRGLGAVGHFPSAVYPNKERDPVFGNLYVFEGEQAVEERMKSPFNKKNKTFSREIVRDIQHTLETVNPLCRMYRSMGEKLAEIEEAKGNIESLRLKIGDTSMVDPKTLQAHTGVYGQTKVYKDYVAVYYTSSVEQEVTLPGLIIYPKFGNRISRPVFPWSDLINPLCYPLLFPFGEKGWTSKKWKYCSDRMSWKKRLEEYAVDHHEEAMNWDTPIGQLTHLESNRDSGDESAGSDLENDDNLNETEYNDQINELHHDADGEEPVITFEERGGVMYPTRVRELTTRTEPEADMLDNSDNENMDDDFGKEESQPNRDHQVTDDARPTGEVNENPQEIIHRKFASFREYVLYIMQQRKLFKKRFTKSGRLGQLFLIDCCTRLYRERYDFIQKHHTQFMTSSPKKFLESYQRRIEGSHRKIGCITSIPCNVPGSPRYLQKKYEEVVALANQLGPADLFITFTANVHWPEIEDNIPHGSTWADFPFLVNEVFTKKFDVFKSVVLGDTQFSSSTNNPGLFGPVLWYAYSVEFQQRGLPHVHMVLSLVNHVRTTADVDKICQAVIPPMPDADDPDYDEKLRLRNLVIDLMVHTPCENNSEAYCQKDKPRYWKTCKKHFPKEFSTETNWGDLTYPELKRPNDGSFCWKRLNNGKRVKADNRHVVSHNTQMLTLFGCHINIEIIAALLSAKYIFKYQFKGYDRQLVATITSNANRIAAGEMTIDGHIMYPTTLKLTKETLQQRNVEARQRLQANNVPLVDDNGNDMLIYDETHFVEDLRCLTSCETAWEMAAYPRTGSSHSVVTLFVHEPHGKYITYEIGGEDEEYERLRANEVPSRLKGWFKLNLDQDPVAQSLTFNDLPKRYRYVKDH